jgi:2-polyprenyl-6-methoxyphenol hydroxylase-like FAD-dependent oxidoreductase
VVTVVEERSSASIYEIRSEYVVACDGAKSAVRKFLGIDCEGEDSCRRDIDAKN